MTPAQVRGRQTEGDEGIDGLLAFVERDAEPMLYSSVLVPSRTLNRSDHDVDHHHDKGFTCVDCHGQDNSATYCWTGCGPCCGCAPRWTRRSFVRVPDLACVACHGDVNEAAQTDGTQILDMAGNPMKSTRVCNQTGERFLLHREAGKLVHIPQTSRLLRLTQPQPGPAPDEAQQQQRCSLRDGGPFKPERDIGPHPFDWYDLFVVRLSEAILNRLRDRERFGEW